MIYFFSCVVILVLSGIKADLLTSLDFVNPGEIYLAYTQPLYLLSFLTPPYPIAQLSPYYITGFSAERLVILLELVLTQD